MKVGLFDKFNICVASDKIVLPYKSYIFAQFVFFAGLVQPQWGLAAPATCVQPVNPPTTTLGSPNGRDSVACGQGATANGDQSTAIGFGSRATESQAVAIGAGSEAAYQSSALGNNTTANGEGSIAFGGDDTEKQANAGYSFNNDIGSRGLGVANGNYRRTTTYGNGSTAIAVHAQALSKGSVAIGVGATAGDGANRSTAWTSTRANQNIEATAIGALSYATSERSTAVGAGAQALANNSFAASSNAQARTTDSIAIGNGAISGSGTVGNSNERKEAIALGKGANASGEQAVSIGSGARSTANQAVSIGQGAQATAADAFALGENAFAGGQNSLSLGAESKTSTQYNVSIGRRTETKGLGAIAIGGGDGTTPTEFKGAQALKNGAIAIGGKGNSGNRGALATESFAVSLGSGSIASTTASVALGSSSVADTVAGVTGYDPLNRSSSVLTGRQWVSTLGAVSIGNGSNTRQITNLAAGKKDTDAVNVAQLKAANKKSYFHVNPSTTAAAASGTNNLDDVDGVGSATGAESLAAGYKAQAAQRHATAVGTEAKAIGENATSVGFRAIAKGTSSTAYGTGASAIGISSVAFGTNTGANKEDVAIGAGALTTTLGATATDADGNKYYPSSSKGQNTAIGAYAGIGMTGQGNTANGFSSGKNVTGNKNTMAGHSAGQNVTGDNNVIFGNSAGHKTGGNRNVLIGGSAGGGSYGPNYEMKGNDNVGNGTGVLAAANGNNNIGIGSVAGAQVTGSNNVSIGNQAGTLASINNGVPSAGGAKTFSNTVNIGNNTKALSNDAVAIGNGAKTNIVGAIALGAGSNADTTLGKVGYDPSGTNQSADTSGVWKATRGAVSIGDVNATSKITRQITDVAAGTEDTDAVNVAQLKALRNGVIGYTTGAGGFALKAQDGNTVTQSLGKSIGIVGTGNDATATYSGNNLKSEVKSGKIEIQMTDRPTFGATKINDNGTGKITGLTAGTITNTSKDAVNGSQLYQMGNSVATSLGGTSTFNTTTGQVTAGLSVEGTTYTSVQDALNKINTKAGKHSTVSNGDNITVTATTVNGKTNYAIATKKSVEFDNVTVGDVVINKTTGINAGKKQITHVASGLGNRTISQIKAQGSSAPEWNNAATIGDLTTVQSSVSNVSTIVGNSGNLTNDQQALKTYNPINRGEKTNNTIISAIKNMNEGGIKYFHTNDSNNNYATSQTNSEDSQAGGAYSTAIGYQAQTAGVGSVALGRATAAEGASSIAIGDGSKATGNRSIAIGTGNVVSGNNSGALGDPNTLSGSGSYVVGNNNTLAADNAFVMGNNVTVATGNNGAVVLGNQSTIDAVHTGNYTVGGQRNAQVAGQTGAGTQVVSIGRVGGERQIQNVAPGVVSANSTDAINGSQLYYTIEELNSNVSNVYQKVTRVEKNANAGVASAIAVANLPQPHDPGASMTSIAVGNYRDESALSLGLSTISDNGRWVLKGSFTQDTQENQSYGAGVGFQW